jgi:hypothetical protein
MSRRPDVQTVIDTAELRSLQVQLGRLLHDVRGRYEPAAQRLGCSRLIDELRVFSLESDQGTACSVHDALRACLRGEDEMAHRGDEMGDRAGR